MRSGEGVETMGERVSGVGVMKFQVEDALKLAGLAGKPSEWSREDLGRVVGFLRRAAKPTLIAANKIDLPSSKENVVRIRQNGSLMVPVSAEAELALRRAVEKGLISYRPGDPDFSVIASAEHG